MATFLSLQSLNAELALDFIQFLSVQDTCRLAQSSRRFYYLVHQFRTHRRPQLAYGKSHNANSSFMDVYRDALGRMQVTPQLILSFSGQHGGAANQHLPHGSFPAPKGATVLGCDSFEAVQTIHCGDSKEVCQIEDRWAVMMLGGLPENTTTILPFQFDRNASIEGYFLPQFNEGIEWKTFIIFAGPGIPAQAVTLLQEKFPTALIIGGVCGTPFLYLPSAEGHITLSESDVCGVAMAGDIPFHAVVSRGVESLTNGRDFVITQSSIIPSEEMPYHLIEEVIDRSQRVPVPLSGAAFLDQCRGNILGVKYPDKDGFTVYESVFGLSDGLLIPTLEVTPMTGCPIDVFQMNRDSMISDLEQSLERLRLSIQDEEILGALLISCYARGPAANSMLCEEMADAKRFAAAFPGVPCLGWYAGGEIGPAARARQQNPLRTGESCIQGITAVFGVFIVPPEDPMSRIILNDTPQAIGDFLQMRLRLASQS